MPKISIKDIAKYANVSPSTVSRALQGHPRISEETKLKIRDIAKQYNYIPNQIARALKTKETKTIGLIISDITNPFYTEITKGVEDACVIKGYSVILCNSDFNLERESSYLKVLTEKGVDGIILTPHSVNYLHDYFFDINHIPYVLVDIKPSNPNVNCVYADQEEGALIATKFLIEKGHRKITFLNGPVKLPSANQAIKGYKRAFNEFGLKINKDSIIETPQKIERAYLITKQLLRKNDNPTAIFSLSDMMCIGIYQAIYEEQLRIPDDIAVVGYDDLPVTRFMDPPLTTVYQPKYEVGNLAAELLIDQIKAGSSWSPRTIKLSARLVVRKST